MENVVDYQNSCSQNEINRFCSWKTFFTLFSLSSFQPKLFKKIKGWLASNVIFSDFSDWSSTAANVGEV